MRVFTLHTGAGEHGDGHQCGLDWGLSSFNKHPAYYMPELGRPSNYHNVRPRNYSKALISKTSMLDDKGFIIRMLYKYVY